MVSAICLNSFSKGTGCPDIFDSKHVIDHHKTIEQILPNTKLKNTKINQIPKNKN
ncbi:hypothetical protein ACIN8IBEIGE_140060 [Acinetobacter sp. 8I-beige]|nr:hypothetical protein ACIN8IBEIGE_140060 [Acinetobacter sp. 8I-beige]